MVRAMITIPEPIPYDWEKEDWTFYDWLRWSMLRPIGEPMAVNMGDLHD